MSLHFVAGFLLCGYIYNIEPNDLQQTWMKFLTPS